MSFVDPVRGTPSSVGKGPATGRPCGRVGSPRDVVLYGVTWGSSDLGRRRPSAIGS